MNIKLKMKGRCGIQLKFFKFNKKRHFLNILLFNLMKFWLVLFSFFFPKSRYLNGVRINEKRLAGEKQFNGFIKIFSQYLFINRKKPFIIEEDFDFIVPLYKINIDITKIKYNDDEQQSVRFKMSISSKEIYDLFYSDIPIYNMQISEIKTEIAFHLYHNYS